MKDFESLIDDLGAAERAGVFARTPQPLLGTAVTNAASSKIFLLPPRWAIAATVLIAAGAWTMMFRTKLSDLRDRTRSVQLATAADLQSALASCVGGPKGALNDYCGRVDFDRDGDVDLSDFGTYQRDLVGTSH
jgi:hypothetical protein